MKDFETNRPLADTISARHLNTLVLRCAAAFVTVASIVMMLITGWPQALGVNIPSADIMSDYATAFIWAVLLGLSIFLWPVGARAKTDLFILWCVKAWIALVPMLLYEAHYPFLDAYSYYELPKSADFVWDFFRFGQGTENIYRLVWLYDAVVPNSYHALKLSFAMIGLVAIYIFYRTAVVWLGKNDRRLFYAIGLFPSILFWSSIVGKEPVVLLGIALCAYGTAVTWRYRKRLSWSLIAGLTIIFYVRPWLVPIILVALVPAFLSRQRKLLQRVVAFGSIAVLVTLSFVLIRNHFLTGNEDAFQAIGRVSQSWAEDGGSGQIIAADLTDVNQLVAFVPVGAFTALFRPLPGEVQNAFGLLAGLESLILLGLVVLALARLRMGEFKNPLVLSAVLFVASWALVYGFLSYQNLGTAVRFRVQVLPIFLFLLFYLGRRRGRSGFRWVAMLADSRRVL